MYPSPIQSTPEATIPARLHESGFALADSNFFSVSRASDGNVYFTLCSHDINTHARLYRYDPRTQIVTLAADFGKAFHEDSRRAVPQGKSHSPYFELHGKLYGATHYGFMNPDAAKEEPGILPEGYQPYPGGHFFSYNLKTAAVEDLARAPQGEGLITMGMDTARQRMYALSWPSGLFFSYDLPTKKMHNHGPVCRGGEAGAGESYICLCRCFAIDPQTGAVFFTLANGDIRRYDYHTTQITTLQTHLRIDALGQWNHQEPGHQGYNWRHVFWYAPWKKFVAVHGKSGWLFTFDPASEKVELLDRICALDLKKSGAYEPFRYGYLTLELGADGHTLYYLTGNYGLTAEDGRRVETTLHLITYHLPTAAYRDHGVLRLSDGRYPKMTQSLLMHTDGRLYSCPWIESRAAAGSSKTKPRDQVDLVSFADPLNHSSEN